MNVSKMKETLCGVVEEEIDNIHTKLRRAQKIREGLEHIDLDKAKYTIVVFHKDSGYGGPDPRRGNLPAPTQVTYQEEGNLRDLIFMAELEYMQRNRDSIPSLSPDQSTLQVFLHVGGDGDVLRIPSQLYEHLRYSSSKK